MPAAEERHGGSPVGEGRGGQKLKSSGERTQRSWGTWQPHRVCLYAAQGGAGGRRSVGVKRAGRPTYTVRDDVYRYSITPKTGVYG